MRKLFQKSKPVKSSREAGEDISKQTLPTPVYHQLATHGAHIHAISLPVFQQSTTQISPPPSQDSWSASVPPPPSPPLGQQEQMAALPNPHSPPINTSNGGSGVTPPLRSDSLHATPHVLSASPGLPRSASPNSTQTIMANAGGTKYGASRFGSGDLIDRRNPSVGAIGILSSLEPPKKDGALSGSGLTIGGTASWGSIPPDEREGRFMGSVSDLGHGGQPPTIDKEKKKGFWNVRDREKEKEREQREREREVQLRKERHEKEQRERGRDTLKKEEDSAGELTRMIGYLTATAAEDWSLLMEVCERASSSEASAKEAVTALRREFKYGEPPAQLSAARVWAVILRNSSEVFISKSTTRKFLDTIEDLLSSPRTSPVVRERLLEVVAAAAFASGPKKGNDNQGFRGLWKRVRPIDKPEEGVPFDMADAMFQPPQSGHGSSHDAPTPPDPSNPTPTAHKKRKSPSNQIIPLEEDMRRLFQECKIGQGNAAVLADALLRAKPEDLKKVDVIKEFHAKCQSSQELICTQIPWATSLAERSRSSSPPENVQQQRNNTTSTTAAGNNNGPTNSPVELTVEEKLLAALLAANAELLEVLRQWDDLNRLAIERKIEDRSRRDVRINKHQQPHREQDHENNSSADAEAGNLPVSSSGTPSPPSRSNSLPAEPPSLPPPPSSFHPDHTNQLRRTPSFYDSDSSIPSQNQQQQNLAPPPAAPHGPRSPVPVQQRSTPPSPTPAPLGLPLVNGHVGGHECDSDSLSSLEEQEEVTPQPSAKALGKRKDVDGASGQPADVTEKFRDNRQSFQSTNGLDPDFEEDQDSRWRHPPVRFVYDAVAERRRQMMMENRGHAEQQQRPVNGVH